MTTQDRTLIMVLIGIVVAAASWFLLIKPQREKAADLQTQVEQAQGQMDAATAQAAAATAARAQYGRDYATVVRLGKAVPADDDIASLIYQLDTSAEKTGVDFRTVAVTDSSGSSTAKADAGAADAGQGAGGQTLPGNVTQVPITMSFTGGYFSMTRFLREVERYTITSGDTIDVRGRLVSIDGVTLKPGAGGFPQVQAEVTATAYRAPVEQVGGDPASGGSATPAGTGSDGSTTESTTASATPAPPTAAARVGK